MTAYRTAQEIFDVSTAALLKQGVAAVDHGSCKYRTLSGHKCAVGHLISDDIDTFFIEGKTVREPLVASAAGIRSTDVELAAALQRAHDRTLDLHGIEKWKQEVRCIASDFGLSARVLDEAEAAASPYLTDASA